MSNRNTPTARARLNVATPRKTAVVAASTGTPSLLQRKFTTNVNSTNEDAEQLLNTAFRGRSGGGVGGVLTPRFKPNPTALNACYTPSSLYRRSGAKKPSSLATAAAASTTPRGARAPVSCVTKTPKSTKTPKTSVAGASAVTADGEISNLTVVVRVRPLNAAECSRRAVTNAVRVRGTSELTVLAGSNADASAGLTHSFAYDRVYYSCDPESRSYAGQEAVFAGTARPLIDRAFEGYNACLFAYGQTGSGKSYSMMGLEALDDDALDGRAPHPEAGIIPRFCHELFRRIEAVSDRLQAEIEVSYFEIYNERIHDLLSVAALEASSGSINAGCGGGGGGGTPMQQRHALKVREHPIWGPYVVDLSVHPVDSYAALRNWLAVGNSQRATAATGMNDKSSRSHSIFNIVLNLTELDSSGEESGSPAAACSSDSQTESTERPLRQTRRSKISLVDLAGSERLSAAGTDSDRIREGVSINKSLLTLGKVIAALSESKRGGAGGGAASGGNFVPYRESVLTWLLRENLGGNSKTVMLATISPASLHIDETLATLRYACQARTIVNRIKVNESPHDKIIRELRAEVDRLKSLRNDYERQKRLSDCSSVCNPTPRKIIIETAVDESEVDALRQQLAERERELNRAQKSWMERLREAEDQRKSELRLLRRKGLALELSSEQKQACLVNLTADPIFSETLFYILPPGSVKIGRTRTSTYCSQPDIVLDGPLVAYHHCIIENEIGRLYITPENADFETYLNGELLHARVQMYHGDRLVIGGSHYFRISNPFCSQHGKNTFVDFQLAHQEILHKQEEKLRRELEEEKCAALSRIELERIENERNFKEREQQLELDQLKFKCNREILETERRVLEEERTEMTTTDVLAAYTPSFKSTLLEDINRIMQNPSEESLHKTQLMVKEATQHCRSLGLKLDFRQSQVLDEFGMFRGVVLILDKEHCRKAEWPTARLGVWLDIMRDSSDADDNSPMRAEKVFNCVDIEWQPIVAGDDDALLLNNETPNDTLNSSRISLNLSVATKDLRQHTQQLPLQKLQLKQLFLPSSAQNCVPAASSGGKTPQQQNLEQLLNAISASASSPLYTKKMLTYDDETPQPLASTPREISGGAQNKSFALLATAHLRDMQRSALRLKRLCGDSENVPHPSSNDRAAQHTVRESVERLESILQGMRCCLEQQLLMESGANSSSICGGGGGPNVSPSKTPKSVRFLID